MRVIILLLFFNPFICYASQTSKNLHITALNDSVYQYTSYMEIEPWGLVGANGLIIIDGRNAHLIDTPWRNADSAQLTEWIDAKQLILKSVVATHFHDDAGSGLAFFNRLNIDTYATALTNKLLRLNNNEAANRVINNESYQLVPNKIELFYPGAGHSQDNIVIWLPQHRLLFGGCLVKHASSKTLGNTADASIEQWPNTIQKIINRYPDIETVIPGHGKLGGINLLRHTANIAHSKIND